MNDYYTAKDIQVLTGVSKSKAYEIVRTLNAKFQKEYKPEILIQAKIPRWYFEEKMVNKRPEKMQLSK